MNIENASTSRLYNLLCSATITAATEAMVSAAADYYNSGQPLHPIILIKFD